jgi:large subunit ribosomal protein L15
MKGQKARSGRGVRLGFQGGQNPLIKSLPSLRGFTNIFRREYIAINLDRLAEFPANSEVTPQLLAKAGVLKNSKQRIKVLGRGELEVPLVVEAHRFSRSAREKIEAVGGQAREID